MKNLIVYVHGKGGSAGEAEHYKTFFPNSEVIGLDYHYQTPWEARKEFRAFFTEQKSRYDHLTLSLDQRMSEEEKQWHPVKSIFNSF